MAQTYSKRVLETRLSARHSVSDYLKYRDTQDSSAIASLIQARLDERYWKAVSSGSQSGFLELAVSCLLIEFFWSLKQGWKDSNRMSRRSFSNFFGSSSAFKALEPYDEDFYTHVRCGLLHQAEVTGGWKVSRRPMQTNLFDPSSKTIQARRFYLAVKKEIVSFLDQLKTKPITDKEWKPVIKKMNYIVENCE